MNTLTRSLLACTLFALLPASIATAADPWVVYDGVDGPGKGKHIVLVSGDEEYRSEEALPMLGKILAQHHGFKCTVLFAIDENGTIDPTVTNNIPGLEALDSADLMIIATRFRNLPPEQMAHFEAYLESGKPVIGLRTATHAFNFSKEPDHPYARYGFNSTEWDGGFGRQVLGETWVAHHGHHKFQSTRAVPAPGMEDSPLLSGCEDIWGPSDVYEVTLPLPGDCKPLLMGQVLTGMNPTDPVFEGEYVQKRGDTETRKTPNDPMMPVAWTKTYTGKSGKTCRVFTTTMGAATDLASEGLRRLVVNAAYWCVGMEDKIPERANVDLVGEYNPTPFGFGTYIQGVKPSDHAL